MAPRWRSRIKLEMPCEANEDCTAKYRCGRARAAKTANSFVLLNSKSVGNPNHACKTSRLFLDISHQDFSNNFVIESLPARVVHRSTHCWILYCTPCFCLLLVSYPWVRRWKSASVRGFGRSRSITPTQWCFPASRLSIDGLANRPICLKRSKHPNVTPAGASTSLTSRKIV